MLKRREVWFKVPVPRIVDDAGYAAVQDQLMAPRLFDLLRGAFVFVGRIFALRKNH